jgi:hypothetical protein
MAGSAGSSRSRSRRRLLEQSTHYAGAAGWLDAYVDALGTLHARGDATDEKAELLTEYAEILIAALGE